MSKVVLVLVGMVTPILVGLVPPAIAQDTAPVVPAPSVIPTPEATPTPERSPQPEAAPPPADLPILPPITSNEDLYKLRNGFPARPLDETEMLRLEITLSRRQAALYRGNTLLKTYPIAVGKPGWETPTGTFKVENKIKDPSWVSPSSKDLVIPGGDPENPLGRFWIGFWTNGKSWIGFHGTPSPQSVGRAASHGCIRMHHHDVEDLFQQVAIGTPVKVLP